MVTYEEVLHVIDRVVMGYLELAGIEEPPVETEAVASALGIGVIKDDGLYFRGTRRNGTIAIRPDDRDERECFILAHEIGEELAVDEIVAELDMFDVSDRFREHLANLFAGALLVPTHWLREVGSVCGYDLRELKRVFCTASHEVIARRFLALGEPAILTIFDDDRQTLRLGEGAVAENVTSLEKMVRELCHRTGQSVDTANDLMRVRAWPIHEEAVKREVVLATVP